MALARKHHEEQATVIKRSVDECDTFVLQIVQLEYAIEKPTPKQIAYWIRQLSESDWKRNYIVLEKFNDGKRNWRCGYLLIEPVEGAQFERLYRVEDFDSANHRCRIGYVDAGQDVDALCTRYLRNTNSWDKTALWCNVSFFLESSGKTPLVGNIPSPFFSKKERKQLIPLLGECEDSFTDAWKKDTIDKPLWHSRPSEDDILYQNDAEEVTLSPMMQWRLDRLDQFIAEGNLDGVERIIGHGVEINAENDEHMRPLDIAARHGNIAIAKILLNNGARVLTKDSWYTPLNVAAKHGQKEFAQFLLDYGAAVDGEDPDEETALMTAVENNHHAIAELLLAHGADPGHYDLMEHCPITLAAWYSDARMVKLLLEYGAYVNQSDMTDRTPLLIAVWKNKRRIIRVLFEYGADPSPYTDYDRIPLHAAAARGNLPMTRLLLEHGADVKMRDSGDATPLFGVCETLMDKYESRGKKLKSMPPASFYSKLLHEKHYDDIVEMLLEKGSPVNAKCLNRRATVLHLAAQMGEASLIRLFLKYGANSNAKDRQKKTPLDMAIEFGNEDITALLKNAGA